MLTLPEHLMILPVLMGSSHYKCIRFVMFVRVLRLSWFFVLVAFSCVQLLPSSIDL